MSQCPTRSKSLVILLSGLLVIPIANTRGQCKAYLPKHGVDCKTLYGHIDFIKTLLYLLSKLLVTRDIYHSPYDMMLNSAKQLKQIEPTSESLSPINLIPDLYVLTSNYYNTCMLMIINC
jgi:hypothetical protein